MKKSLHLFGITLLALAFSGQAAIAHEFSIIFQNSDLLAKGRELVRDGRSLEARTAFEDALNRDLTDPQRAIAHNGICVSYIMEESWDQAMVHCNSAIRIVPNNWRFYNNRGNIYLQTGQLEKARMEYERGLKLAPQAFVIKRNLELADRWSSNATTPAPSQNQPI